MLYEYNKKTTTTILLLLLLHPQLQLFNYYKSYNSEK